MWLTGCRLVRRKQDKFKGLSFTTISSTGPNAAIIHYSPSATECAKIDRDQASLLPFQAA